MNQKFDENGKTPQEVPDKKNPYNPQPDKSPGTQTNPSPSKNNPINPQEDR